MPSSAPVSEAASATLVLLPGLGADGRLFDDLEAFAPPFVTPAWPTPEPRESLAEYARRWAPELRCQLGERPIVLGGMSFGGQVALELASHLRPRAVVLLASHPDSDELTVRFRRQVRLLPLLPDAVLRWGLRRIAMPLIARRERLSREQRARLLAMAADENLTFFRWASRAAAEWRRRADAVLPCPLLRLHGEHDSVIPLGRREAVEVLDAGHLIPMTHAAEVGACLHRAAAAAFA